MKATRENLFHTFLKVSGTMLAIFDIVVPWLTDIMP